MLDDFICRCWFWKKNTADLKIEKYHKQKKSLIIVHFTLSLHYLMHYHFHEYFPLNLQDSGTNCQDYPEPDRWGNFLQLTVWSTCASSRTFFSNDRSFSHAEQYKLMMSVEIRPKMCTIVFISHFIIQLSLLQRDRWKHGDQLKLNMAAVHRLGCLQWLWHWKKVV